MKEKIIIEKIPKNLGGGFTAYNEKQKYACRGDGKTEVEALQDFLENWKIFLKHRKYWIQSRIAKFIQIAHDIKKVGYTKKDSTSTIFDLKH
jgi:hypothetical protein